MGKEAGGLATIETATRRDLPEILALQHLAYLSEGELYNDFSLPPLLQTLQEINTDFNSQLFLKAIADTRLVGSVRAYGESGTCYVGRLIVHPDFQDRGIGGRLLDEIESRFPNARRYELFTGQLSKKPLHIYEKRGYQPFRTEQIHEGLTIVYLEKRRQDESG
jgi:ribosomal protein S18 acetylase RimI-like enzyme